MAEKTEFSYLSEIGGRGGGDPERSDKTFDSNILTSEAG